MHFMINSDLCGRDDGHEGGCRSYASMERKRERDRERMARLYAEGQTWWQRRGRGSYDYCRTMFYNDRVRRLERMASTADELTCMAQELSGYLDPASFGIPDIEQIVGNHAAVIYAPGRVPLFHSP